METTHSSLKAEDESCNQLDQVQLGPDQTAAQDNCSEHQHAEKVEDADHSIPQLHPGPPRTIKRINPRVNASTLRIDQKSLRRVNDWRAEGLRLRDMTKPYNQENTYRGLCKRCMIKTNPTHYNYTICPYPCFFCGEDSHVGEMCSKSPFYEKEWKLIPQRKPAPANKQKQPPPAQRKARPTRSRRAKANKLTEEVKTLLKDQKEPPSRSMHIQQPLPPFREVMRQIFPENSSTNNTMHLQAGQQDLQQPAQRNDLMSSYTSTPPNVQSQYNLVSEGYYPSDPPSDYFPFGSSDDLSTALPNFANFSNSYYPATVPGFSNMLEDETDYYHEASTSYVGLGFSELGRGDLDMECPLMDMSTVSGSSFKDEGDKVAKEESKENL